MFAKTPQHELNSNPSKSLLLRHLLSSTPTSQMQIFQSSKHKFSKKTSPHPRVTAPTYLGDANSSSLSCSHIGLFDPIKDQYYLKEWSGTHQPSDT